jgi:hypothetical protein
MKENKNINAELLATVIILKDLIVRLHLNPLNHNEAQNWVDDLNQIADNLTKKILDK